MAIGCTLWVCTSAGHWKVAQDAWVATSASHWKEAKALWYKTTRWELKCAGGAVGTGYLMGGLGHVAGQEKTFDVVDKLHFITETISVIATKLAYAFQYTCNFASKKKAYISYYNYVEGVVFATATTFKTTHALPSWQYDAAGLSDILNTGFVCGGRSGRGNSVIYKDHIFTVSYVNEVTTNIHKSISQPRDYFRGSGTLTYGFLYGGSTKVGGNNRTRVNTMDRLVYATKTSARSSKHLLGSRSGTCPVGNKTMAYLCGGSQPGGVNFIRNIDKIAYSTQVITVSGSLLTTGITNGAGLGAGLKGFIAGGRSSVAPGTEDIDKITFATHAIAKVHYSLHLERSSIGAGTDRGVQL